MGSAARVMIVEDHAIFAGALRLVLERTDGIDVVGVAADGLEAVELANRSAAEIVLMDLGLPRMDGLETTRRLLALNPSTRVIVISGRTDRADREAALEAGAVEYLTKGEIHEQVRDAVLRAAAQIDGPATALIEHQA